MFLCYGLFENEHTPQAQKLILFAFSLRTQCYYKLSKKILVDNTFLDKNKKQKYYVIEMFLIFDNMQYFFMKNIRQHMFENYCEQLGIFFATVPEHIFY